MTRGRGSTTGRRASIALLELADRQAAGGQGEAPYPPHFPKAEGEPGERSRRDGARAMPRIPKGSVPPPARGETDRTDGQAPYPGCR